MLLEAWDNANTLAEPTTPVTVSDRIDASVAVLVDLYGLVRDADPDPGLVTEYLIEPASQWAAAAAVAGRTVPQNEATLKALRVANRDLLAFYDAELRPRY